MHCFHSSYNHGLARRGGGGGVRHQGEDNNNLSQKNVLLNKLHFGLLTGADTFKQETEIY